jgi:thioredoxin-related protein
MEASINDFNAITGCTNDDDARKFLLMYDNDMNRAVDRYFNQKNRDFVKKETNGASSSSRSTATRNNFDSAIEPMDTNEPGPSRRPIGRRAMTVRNPHPLPSAPEVSIIDDEEGIRRPIAPVTGQLLSESFQQSWRAGVSRPANGIFQTTTDFRALARQQEQRLNAAHLNRVNGGPSNGVDRKSKTLQSLFQPPTELLFIGPWEAARHQASLQNRWLLVNLQHNSEFSCACINRDIWNKETVQELVKKNFIFWQVADDSPDCKRVSSYYNVTKFPTVLIIDPRTGEAVSSLTKWKDTVSFLEELMEFLERFPDFATYDQSFVTNSNKAGPSDDDIIIEEASVNGKEKRGHKRKIENDSNDLPSSSKKRLRVTQPSSSSQTNNVIDVDMGEIDELCNNGTKLTTVDKEEWKNFIGLEENGCQKIQIVFRLPNNEREKIEIPDTTQLRALFVFLDGRGLNSRDHVLVLTYPRREFFFDQHSSQTLRQLRFNRQELIHVDKK